MDVCRRNLPALDVGMEHLDGDLDAVVLGERGPVDLSAAPRPHGFADSGDELVFCGARWPTQGVRCHACPQTETFSARVAFPGIQIDPIGWDFN